MHTIFRCCIFGYLTVLWLATLVLLYMMSHSNTMINVTVCSPTATSSNTMGSGGSWAGDWEPGPLTWLAGLINRDIRTAATQFLPG